MAKFSLFILALSAALTNAIQVPADHPDGVYTVEFGSDGLAKHEPIVTTRSYPTENSAKFSPRAVTWPKNTYPACKLSILSELDWTSATSQLRQACANSGETHYKDKQAIYAVYGGAVAYMCSYSSKGNPCRVDEWDDALSKVQGQCKIAQDGNGVKNGVQSGWLWVGGWNKSYGWQDIQNGFC